MIAAWLNGKEVDGLSLTDRGLHYGDGFFSTVAVLSGKALLWNFHLERVLSHAKRLNLKLDVSRLEQEVYAFLKTHVEQQGESHRQVLKMVITREESGRGYHWGDNLGCNILLQLFEYPGYAQLEQLRVQGLKLTICETRLSHGSLTAGLKLLGRIEQVLGSGELDKKQFDEGLMLDAGDHVVEGCSSNLVMLKNGHLKSPNLDRCGIEGVMKAYIFKSCESLGYQFTSTDIKLGDLEQTDAIFMTNALWGLCPVQSIEGISWSPKKVEQDKLVTAFTAYQEQSTIAWF